MDDVFGIQVMVRSCCKSCSIANGKLLPNLSSSRLFLLAFHFHQRRKFPGQNLSLKKVCRGKLRQFSKRGLDRSQKEQPIKKNKFSYFARSRLRLRPQEIWERDYTQTSLFSNMTEIDSAPRLNAVSCNKKSASVQQAHVATNFNLIKTQQKIGQCAVAFIQILIPFARVEAHLRGVFMSAV